ncbi:MAG: flagellar filament capping protein FliD, partial [Campylobacterota bacterium]|nr:flagellar filament capping protein FliD [Campylobacterota bacterium]
MADYSALGIAGGGGASLNQELIDKIKAAERKSQVDPIETRLEAITGLDAQTGDVLDVAGEEARMLLIEAQATDMMNKISGFDLFSSEANAFEQVLASTTGDAAVFDAIDIGGLTPGTNYVTITQLAQRDVFQTSTFSEAQKDEVMTTGQASGDMIVISQDGRPVYQSDSTTTDPSTDLILGAGESGTVVVGATTVNIDDTTTWDDLKTQLSANADLTVSFENNRLSVKSADGETALSISETGNVAIGLTIGEKFTTEGKTYTELATSINDNSNYTASIELVGDDTYRLVMKSNESGLSNALNITQIGADLDINDTYSSKAVSGAVGVDGTLDVDGAGNVAYLSTDTLSDVADKINSAGLGYTASFDAATNKLSIEKDDGSAINSISSSEFDFGFDNDSQTLNAQNLLANVDGIDYNVDSNVLTVQGNLTMTAVELGSSTISIQRDSSSVLTTFEAFIESYNALVDLIDNEVYGEDSPIQDASSLKMMMGSIKDMIFGSYGENDDQNLFGYGLSLDESG